MIEIIDCAKNREEKERREEYKKEIIEKNNELICYYDAVTVLEAVEHFITLPFVCDDIRQIIFKLYDFIGNQRILIHFDNK